MAADARFDVDSTQWQEPRKRSKLQSCLMGCLVVLVVMAVLAVLVGIWVSHRWRDLVSTFGSSAIKQAIESSDLSPQEKQGIADQVDRVADGFRSGRLSGEQMGSIMENVTKSPLMTTIMVSAADKQYFDKSRLSDAEKAAGRQTVRRFARGSIDHKIDQQGMDAALAHISHRESNGSIRMRQNVSDDELRAFLAEAKVQADKAAIPEEPANFDAAAEFKKIIDEATSANQYEPAADEKLGTPARDATK
jgi:hypothetical protein